MIQQKKNNTKLVTGVSTSNKVLGLIPTVVRKDNILDLSGAVQLYEDYLPSPELCTLELRRWKQYWQACPLDSCPSTCAATIKTVDKLIYPKIAVLLKIACTLSVTSCECERRASALRRLHTWSRASMGQERFAALALLHVFYNESIDFDDVTDRSSSKHPRKMELDNVFNS